MRPYDNAAQITCSEVSHYSTRHTHEYNYKPESLKKIHYSISFSLSD